MGCFENMKNEQEMIELAKKLFVQMMTEERNACYVARESIHDAKEFFSTLESMTEEQDE
jgi:hypothetical protein